MVSEQSSDGSTLVAAICADQRRCWSTGQRMLAEDYRQQHPALRANSEWMLDLIYNEVTIRRLRGEPVDSRDFCRRFPEFETEISALLSIDEALVYSDLSELLDADDPEQTTPMPRLAAEFDDVTSEVDLARAMQGSREWSQLPQETISALVRAGMRRQFASGEKIIRQGDAATSLFLIVDGNVQVSLVDAVGRHHVLSELSAGAVFGELGTLMDRPRSAYVTALTDVVALEVPSEAVLDAVLNFPALNATLFNLIGERVGDRQYDVLTGHTFDRYRVVKRLGRGTMGVVYGALDTSRNQTVALKMLRHNLVFNPEAVQRFHREAEILASLDHPGIVRFIEGFTALKTFFIVTDYVAAESLASLLQKKGRLKEEVVRNIARQLVDILAYAHARGIVHRDLKPANILVRSDRRISLTDFGLSRSLATSGFSQANQIIGTPRYMAPEQLAADECDESVDVFALGCIVYEMLTGGPPFNAPHVPGIVRQQAGWSLPSRESIRKNLAPDLYEVLRGALAMERCERSIPATFR